MREIDQYFEKHTEPTKGYLSALRGYLLDFDPHVIEVWRYKMPFYCILEKGKREQRFCYLWTEKKSGRPYIGIVDGALIHHEDLISEKRSKMKIMLLDPDEDIPVDKIAVILNQAIQWAKNRG